MIDYTPHNKHTCLFYNSKDELLDILVPYFKAGLENNECCIWVISETLEAEEARSTLKKAVKNLDYYLAKGQMEIGHYKDYYLKSGVFNSAEILEHWAKKEKEALERGFKRMRVSADGSWALTEEYWLNLYLYEEEVNKVIEDFHGIAICTYSISKLRLHQIFDIGISHQASLCRRMGQWDILPPSDFHQAKEKLT